MGASAQQFVGQLVGALRTPAVLADPARAVVPLAALSRRLAENADASYANAALAADLLLGLQLRAPLSAGDPGADDRGHAVAALLDGCRADPQRMERLAEAAARQLPYAIGVSAAARGAADRLLDDDDDALREWGGTVLIWLADAVVPAVPHDPELARRMAAACNGGGTAGGEMDGAAATQLRDIAAQAFPPELGPEVGQALDLLVPSRHGPVRHFEASVGEQRIRIPYRIYDDPPPGELGDLSERTRAVLHCLLTRHHDGYVRQQHAEKVISVDAEWVAPFVVALLGEYVVEIVDSVRTGLADLDTPGAWHRRRYGRFVVDNPGFMALTRQRAVSYWDCYYRRRYPDFASYPAAQVLASLKSAALDYTPRA